MQFNRFPISSDILANLERMGFHKTTDIQYKAIPAILKGEDLLAIAQTGTGKTAAFAIPVIHKVHSNKTSKSTYGLKVIVLTPTRELAKQVGSVFAKLSKGTKASTFALYGGVSQDPQKDMLKSGVDILITTPGRMFDLIHQGDLDVSNVSCVVVDEADQMLDLGFANDIKGIKTKIKNHRHQTLFFSATINPKIKKLAYSHIKSSAMRIQISPEQIVSKNVDHFLVKVEMDNKRHLLTNFLKEQPDAKTIVFVRTQLRVERVAKHLAKNQIDSFMLFGNQDQEDRMDAIDQFNKVNSGVLIATDLSARGIDFKNVTYVINYDLPENPENYVHRVGRTGRGTQYGEAISFCSPEEASKREDIEDFLGREIDEMAANTSFLLEGGREALEDMEISDILKMEENLFS
ncbi:MAG: hypothetical protein CL674_03485 [Bdellovibrionaceae bacterium]|nr:hypothetical protein [Pseudobdellovibrionaceae bacterium]|tara:strand:- start:46998 stop:48212 length:1215 start_codon:yes stop_codon:yes gene_type:complete